MGTMAPHPYKPLKEGEIRVLRLKPGIGDEPLFGTLEHVVLQKATYRAISYAWGEPVFNKSIFTTSQEFPNTTSVFDLIHRSQKIKREESRVSIAAQEFSITTSLFDALHRFRDAKKDIHLWADQICINQSDLEERNAQVAVMAKIYGRAREVSVWLGGPEEHHDAAFAMMDFLAGRWLTSVGELDNSPPLNTIRLIWAGRRDIRFSFEDGLVGFSTIARKRWFDRLWVVQEVLAARSGLHPRHIDHHHSVFYCGHYFTHFSNAVKAMKRFNRIIEDHFLSAFDASKEKRVANVFNNSMFNSTIYPRQEQPLFRAHRFFQILCETSHLKASEPRDRVYALASIANKDEGDKIHVDYAIEMPDLWRLVARFLLKAVMSEEHIVDTGREMQVVLALSATQSDTSEVNSSWSPDYNALTPESHRKRAWYKNEPGISRAGDPRFAAAPTMSQGEEAGVWLWKGAILDKVDRILEGSNVPLLPITFSSPQDLVDPACELVYHYLDCFQFARTVVPSINRPDFKHLFKQGTRQLNLDPYREALGTAFKIARTRILVSVSRDVLNDLCQFPLTEGLSYMDHSRLLACTTKRHLGWVPKQTKVGDQVCLLPGFPAPFIVRQLTDGYNAIVGDAYIHGIYGLISLPGGENKIEVKVMKFK